MNANEKFLPMVHALRNVLLALIAVAAPFAPAATVWTGPPFNFTHASGSDPTLPANQDRITDNVWLTRASSQGIFNARTESAFTHSFSPAGTAWATGTTADYASLTYTDWDAWAETVNGPPNTVGLNAVVHLISEDIYLDIKFTSWQMAGGGGFAYVRSTAQTAPPAPTVSITNPPTGAVFTAPASVLIQANATVTSGSVTNVTFFGNGAPLGSDQTAPFSTTTGSLVAGPYALTAVATAAGVSSTSSIVNITVVSAPTVTITNPPNGAVFAEPANVQIQATADVSGDSVTNVAFFGNGAPLGSDQTAPFSTTTGSLAAGPYALTAVATATGISTTSAVVNITVVAAPTVTITNPPNGAVFAEPANVQIQATADVSSGSVTNVEFFANGAPLGSDQTAPFSTTTGSLAAGPYALTAVATAAGISATSTVVNITVVAPAPTVSITNPPNNAVFAEPANVQIQADAAMSGGSVTNVEFLSNGAPLGSDQDAPFSLTTGSLSAGVYSLTAVATAAGVSSTSSVVSITVVSPIAISLTSPQITNGQFSFDYSANPGLSYVVQNSSNLVDWVPVLTNVADSNPVHFTDELIPGGNRFYQVGRQPNP